MKRIAVIGGGPKAAAICAKAWCLDPTRKRLRVDVFEKTEFGSAWGGRHGYTDGDQKLCTPAERDVGFPYEEGLLDEDGVKRLFSTFSWGAYLIEAAGSPLGYREWVDRGRKAPTHRIYAQYIAWVLRASGQIRAAREVVGLDHRDDRWSVRYRLRGGVEKARGDFDGVVITGPGPALSGFQRPRDPRIIDGNAFWRTPETFLRRARGSDGPIIIAGSGGTSAAIAARIVRRDPGRPVIIIGNQGALFTRTESFFENALFTDEDAWRALRADERVAVTQRLNRGVVWASVSETLSASGDVRFRPGRVTGAVVQPGVRGAPAELRVDVIDASGEWNDPASLVIDASGFDPWWFLSLLPDRMQRLARGRGDATAERRRQELRSTIDRDLSVDLGATGLHVPMLALAQGPGFASLMVLGSMSERILQSYVEPA